MSSNRKPTHIGPKIPRQAGPDTSIIGDRNNGPRRGEGDPNKNGAIAIADVPLKNPGGSIPHHCPYGHAYNTSRCNKLGCFAKCAGCGSYITNRKSTTCRTCKTVAFVNAREQREREERERKAAEMAKDAWQGLDAKKRKARHTADQRQQRELHQKAAQAANQKKQADKAGGIAKMLFAYRPVGVRKRTGRVGGRGSGRPAPRLGHAYQRRSVSWAVDDDVVAAEKMHEEDDEWEDEDTTEAEQGKAVSVEEAQRQRMEEDSALQRRIRENLWRLTS